MMKGTQQQRGRLQERISILLIGICLFFAFLRLYSILEGRMKGAEKGLAEGSIVNLNAEDPANAMKAMLSKGYYFDDPADIEMVKSVIASKQQEDRFSNIGDLNKKKYYISADRAAQFGGASFRKRVAVSRALLGFSGEDEKRFDQELTAPPAMSSLKDMAMGRASIGGRIKNEENVVAGVLVRLTAIFPADSIDARPFTAYARTDQDGKYEFTGLPEGKAYEVIPLKPGAEFGQVKGVEKLNSYKTLNFTEVSHRIRLLSSRDFNILKMEGALVVRTPADFKIYYWLIAGALLLGFCLVHIVLSVRFPEADQLMLPLLMLLIGISFLTLLSLQDPLRDRFLVADVAWYLYLGFAGILVLLAFKLKSFTSDSKFYRLFMFSHRRDAANGWPWIMMAIGLLVITLLFGAGPEGSGVKVNLLGVQPSEVVKYSVVLFLAGFFAMNEHFISSYSSWKKRWSFFSFALLAILVTLLLFLLLGDLGPAIVICFTFIVLFSFSRGDFMEMAAFVILYILVAWLLDNVWLDALITFVLLALYHFLKKKSASESAIMALVVITAFLTIDQIPYLDNIVPGPVERLSDRKAIWHDAWDNEVYGGDQVANGLWAISSGGFSGQGVGKGFAKTIPEAHTDMILPAMAEDFGWLGMALIFGLFLLYLHRAIVIGRQTGTPFLFYCCAGIGICTFIQFLLIAGGSLGALPLSGVSLPFESYGGSSLVINMLAAGFLLSASMVKGTEGQMRYLSRQQDNNLVPALLASCIGVLLLLVNVSRYSFNNRPWLIKPALVADKSGSRMFSYNPRIGILMKKLQAGNLYDRSGLLLASSDPKLVKKQEQQIAEARGSGYDLDSALHRRNDRFYPFEEQMFFWTGDANTGVFNGGINGYFAEYEHAAELRGFKMPLSSYHLTASRYREDRFLPQGPKEMTLLKKDFSALSDLLISGLDSNQIALFRGRNRDVKLSVDADLQAHLQASLSRNPAVRHNRVSVVVMSSNTGDVLASAVYPLPPLKNWEQLTMSRTDQNKLAGWITTADLGFTVATQPGSTAKLLTAMAAFNKMGPDAAQQTYLVKANERIRSGGPEPDETGRIDMERAILKSNNVYFIKLANQQQLAEPMGELYLKTGMFLHGVGGYYYGRTALSPEQKDHWFDLWRRTEFNSPYHADNIYRNRATGISGMSWGQGELIATPASVARLAAAISNGGKLVPNRYVLKLNDSTVSSREGELLAKDPAYAELLKQYMIAQSAGKAGIFGIAVAGKTGTPERIFRGRKVNDGWYVFFAPNEDAAAGYTVTCIRIEDTKGSSEAVRLAAEVVIPLLKQKGYVKSIN